MKGTSIFSLIVLTTVMAVGQSKNVNKANTLFTAQKYAEAIEMIEPATTFEKTKGKGRTWYVRGQIYGAIASAEDATINATDPKAIEKAAESYNKVFELEKENSTYYSMSTLNINSLFNAIIDKGIKSYNDDDLEAAYKSFTQATIVKPTDTLGIEYAGTTAQQLEKYDEALAKYYKLFELGSYSTATFNRVISIEMSVKEDYEKALKTVKLAKEKFPDEDNFSKYEIDLLIKTDQLDAAIVGLKETIKAEPNNGNLYYNLGYILSESGKHEEAIETYIKGIEVQADYIPLYFNLSYLFIEKGNVLNKKANDMDIKTYNKEGDAVLAQAKEWYEKAIPYLEKVNDMQPDDQNTLEALQGIYVRTKQNDKAEAIYNKREELGFIEPEN